MFYSLTKYFSDVEPSHIKCVTLPKKSPVYEPPISCTLFLIDSLCIFDKCVAVITQSYIITFKMGHWKLGMDLFSDKHTLIACGPSTLL